MTEPTLAPLFSPNGRYYTEAGLEVESRFQQAVRPIFQELLKAGYSPRELGYLITRAVIDVECSEILELQWQEKKANG